jgi:hypothetical protein
MDARTCSVRSLSTKRRSRSSRSVPEVFDALVGASSNRDLLSIEPDYFIQGLIPIARRQACA